MPENSNSHESVNIVINEAQLILAEKRTSLAVLRTGIAVLVLPLSVASLLIVTSKYYDIIQVMHLFLPLMILCTILVVLGGYLIVRSTLRIHHYDRLIRDLKRKHSLIAELVDWCFRFLYGLRTISHFVIGMSSVSVKKFILLNAAGALVWAAAVASGGCLFGRALEVFIGKLKS